MADKPDKYTVIIDTREKNPWLFPPDEICAGSVIQGMKTADYTIEGMEGRFAIERKASTAEFAQNITEERFEKELKRLEDIEFPFMLFEFTMNDLCLFPVGSGIPQHLWKKLRITHKFLLKKFVDYQTRFRTKIIFCGAQFGPVTATQLFKCMNLKR